MNLTRYREWLETLADARAQVPADEALARCPETKIEARAEELLTVSEVAGELDRAESTVRGWLGSGLLDGFRLRGREWRIRRSALTAFLEAEEADDRADDASPSGSSDEADLGSWRQVREGRGEAA